MGRAGAYRLAARYVEADAMIVALCAVGYILALLFFWSLCKVAAVADKRMGLE